MYTSFQILERFDGVGPVNGESGIDYAPVADRRAVFPQIIDPMPEGHGFNLPGQAIGAVKPETVAAAKVPRRVFDKQEYFFHFGSSFMRRTLS
jgi:hypothetical protein